MCQTVHLLRPVTSLLSHRCKDKSSNMKSPPPGRRCLVPFSPYKIRRPQQVREGETIYLNYFMLQMRWHRNIYQSASN